MQKPQDVSLRLAAAEQRSTLRPARRRNEFYAKLIWAFNKRDVASHIRQKHGATIMKWTREFIIFATS
jgi:hypothetical protein